MDAYIHYCVASRFSEPPTLASQPNSPSMGSRQTNDALPHAALACWLHSLSGSPCHNLASCLLRFIGQSTASINFPSSSWRHPLPVIGGRKSPLFSPQTQPRYTLQFQPSTLPSAGVEKVDTGLGLHVLVLFTSPQKQNDASSPNNRPEPVYSCSCQLPLTLGPLYMRSQAAQKKSFKHSK